MADVGASTLVGGESVIISACEWCRCGAGEEAD